MCTLDQTPGCLARTITGLREPAGGLATPGACYPGSRGLPLDRIEHIRALHQPQPTELHNG